MQIAQTQPKLLNPSMVALILVVLMTLSAVNAYVKAGEDSSGYSWLVLISIVQVTPFLVGLVLRSQNYLNFILMSHFVGFSVSKYNEIETLSKGKGISLSWIAACKELVICTLCMLVAFHMLRMVITPAELRQRKFNDLSLKPNNLRWITAYILMIPFLPNFLPGSLMIIHLAMASAQVLLVICAECPKNPRLLMWARLSVPVACLASFMSWGFLTMFGNYASFLFMYSFLHQKKKYFVFIAILVLFVSTIQSIKHPYRTFLYELGGAEMAYSQRAGYLIYLFNLKYINPEDDVDELFEREDSKEQSLVRGFNRIGDDSLERVLALTPSVVPFWNGETYDSIPYMFIPRTLWADKPGRHFWNKFGRQYKVLSSDDFNTSVGVGFLAEAYMNFGYAWMYLVAGLVGMLIAGVERLALGILKEKFYFPYITFMGPFIGLGADLGSIVNSTMILSCCFFAARPFLLRLARRDDYS